MDSTCIFWVILCKVTASCMLRRNSVTDNVFFFVVWMTSLHSWAFFSQINPFATVRETFHLVRPNEEFPQKATIFRVTQKENEEPESVCDRKHVIDLWQFENNHTVNIIEETQTRSRSESIRRLSNQISLIHDKLSSSRRLAKVTAFSTPISASPSSPR